MVCGNSFERVVESNIVSLRNAFIWQGYALREAYREIAGGSTIAKIRGHMDPSNVQWLHFIYNIKMKTFGGKLVNHGFFHDLGQKLETAGKIAGTVHTIYNTAKFLQPYVAGALRISSFI